MRNMPVKGILYTLMAVYFVIMTVISFNLYYTFRTYAYDLGLFAQSIWSTLHSSSVLYNTPENFWFCVNTHLGVHFSPILLFLVPIYGIFPYPETLLVIQALIIALSAYPLFLLSNKILQNRILSLGLVVLYLMNSLLHGINSYDFHATPFALPFIFLTALYIEEGRYKKAMLSALLILTVKEDAGLSLVSLGAFYLLRNVKILSLQSHWSLFKRAYHGKLSQLEKVSLFLGILGMAWVLFSWRVLIPHIAGIHITFSTYYSGFPCPGYIPMKVLYFIVANLTLGLLTFLRPKYTFLLTFLPWIEVLLSCQINMFRIGFQYPYMVLSLSIISIIYAIHDFQGKDKSEDIRKILAIGISLGILFSILTTPILPLNNVIKRELFVPSNYYQSVTHHHKLLMNITDILEETNFSILTQNDIFPHLANRLDTHVIWGSYCGKNLPQTDIILLDETLLYSIHRFAVEPYLVNYTKIYEYDGIEIWMKNSTLTQPEAEALLKQLEGVK